MSERRIYGVPGGGLKNATWAANQGVAAVGADGERKTAAVLNEAALAGRGAVVLHDVMIPSARYTANVDHVVVTGNRVLLIDSKVWKPGRYWTLLGATRRGSRRFEHADKATMSVAVKAFSAWLIEAKGLRAAQVPISVLVVWPSSKRGDLRLGLYRPNGARAMRGDALAKWARRNVTRAAPADDDLVRAIAERLVAGDPHTSRPTSRSPNRSVGVPSEPSPVQEQAQAPLAPARLASGGERLDPFSL